MIAICDVCHSRNDHSLSMCEYPPIGKPTCTRSLCRACARFFGPLMLCACPEHAAAMQDHVLGVAIGDA